MKIVNRGFSITEVDVPGVMGMDVDVIGIEGEETITVVTGAGRENLSFSRQEWRNFSAAVTAVNERLDGTPAGTDTRSTIIDNDGDSWYPIEGTDMYAQSGMTTRTRTQIRGSYGIREG